jgi:predicted dehydrogenase
MNQASHHIDMLRWMIGEPKSIIGFCATMTHNIEAEDTGIAIVKFKNGAFGTIEATTCVYPHNLEGSVSIFGEDGSVKIGGTSMNEVSLWKFRDNAEEDENISDFSTNPPNVYGFGHLEYFKDVVKYILEDSDPVIDGKEGLKSLEVIEAIYKSIELGGKEVEFPLKNE